MLFDDKRLTRNGTTLAISATHSDPSARRSEPHPGIAQSNASNCSSLQQVQRIQPF
ncbi:hypothetical protein EJ02DRAFT_457833 [Clathrospora elynae]|uniref:Uncharacterized protein n=1 Tax=Clathrospora elynae TaxID=706981 RepID=A0A6A5SD16_9PLEO|nr:hypothetical protein EJ02DRAFT_457833 [Clathrospora elynae]